MAQTLMFDDEEISFSIENRRGQFWVLVDTYPIVLPIATEEAARRMVTVAVRRYKNLLK